MVVDYEDVRIEIDEAKAKIDSGEAVALDVVQPHAWEELDGAVKGAVRIAPDDIAGRFRELPRELGIITYCT